MKGLDSTPKIIDFIKRYLPHDPVIIEAGGCEGSDTLHFAHLWPQGRIYTFEPVPTLFEQLKEKTKTYKNVFPYAYALSDQTGRAKMYLSETYSKPGHVSGSSSLMQPLEHLYYCDFIRFVDEMECETITFDEWAHNVGLEKVDFMWLDMQGSELPMLRKSTLAQTASAIYIEVSFVESYKNQDHYRDVKEWMLNHDFQLAATDFDEELIEKNLAEKNCFFGNAFFVKNSSSRA